METISLHKEQPADVTGCSKQVSTTDVDCGKSVVTEYFSPDGNLVRRDTDIQVSEEFMRRNGFMIQGAKL